MYFEMRWTRVGFISGYTMQNFFWQIYSGFVKTSNMQWQNKGLVKPSLIFDTICLRIDGTVIHDEELADCFRHLTKILCRHCM